jgi:hypothetical protein
MISGMAATTYPAFSQCKAAKSADLLAGRRALGFMRRRRRSTPKPLPRAKPVSERRTNELFSYLHCWQVPCCWNKQTRAETKPPGLAFINSTQTYEETPALNRRCSPHRDNISAGRRQTE